MQGFQRYYKPDFDWKDKQKDTLNKVAGKHALGDRARKLDKGILIVRFELPFNVWCGTCNNHIGAGVRYNAEKKKIGSYYSTPIFSFRCKCHLCAGWFEVQTDPKNTRYVVTEGAKQQAQDWDPEEEGGFPASYTREGEGPAAKGSEAGGAFASFEQQATSKKRAMTAQERLDEMEQYSEDRWSDPFALNRNLRRSFREHKGKQRERVGQDDALADKYGLGEKVRLDLVRGDEEIREDADGTRDPRASWLSSADKREKQFNEEDGEQWKLAQLAKAKAERDETERKQALVAETGWTEASLVKRRPTVTTPSDRRRVSTVRAAAAPPPPPPSSAASRLSSQLRMNAARKSDPFSSAFVLPGPSSAASSLASALAKPARR